MNSKIKATLIMAALMMSMSLVAFTSGASVTPVLIDPWTSGNGMFEADSIGYEYGYKIEDWDEENGMDGTYEVSFTPNGGTITFTITISNSDGYTFDWESTYPIGAVIVKGGPVANVFNYDPTAYSDTGLYAPLNPNTKAEDDTYTISHVTFCWNPPPDFVIPETPWGVVGTMLTMLAAVALFTSRRGLTIKL